MEENENVVETTENVEEQATENLVEGQEVTTETESVNNDTQENEKLYTEADIDKLVNARVDEILPSKIERAKNRIRREYENKYGRVETVLNAGLGTDNLEDATNKLAEFYKDRGIDIPIQPTYSQRDMELLANAEATEIINAGYADIVEEVDRLADIGVDKMTPREKLVFTKLANERKRQEGLNELASIGVKPEALEDKEYKDFASKLNPEMSQKEKYEMYLKFKPKPKVEQIGSMKTTVPEKSLKDKDSLTPDEVRRLTSKDLDDPEIMKLVEKSMQDWEQHK
jgi:hypothetical protein